MKWRQMIWTPVVALSITAAATPGYRSVMVDSAGQLHIVLDNGREVLPPKAEGQVSFGNPTISPDRRTVGWLVLYEYPNPSEAKGPVREPIPGSLVLYRGGRVIHRFKTEQTFWDWQFQDGGKRVAYCTGPTHGGAAECILREVESGRVIADWGVRGAGKPPDWARTLHM
jgi:hypothetical protein